MTLEKRFGLDLERTPKESTGICTRLGFKDIFLFYARKALQDLFATSILQQVGDHMNVDVATVFVKQ